MISPCRLIFFDVQIGGIWTAPRRGGRSLPQGGGRSIDRSKANVLEFCLSFGQNIHFLLTGDLFKILKICLFFVNDGNGLNR